MPNIDWQKLRAATCIVMALFLIIVLWIWLLAVLPVLPGLFVLCLPFLAFLIGTVYVGMD